MLDSHASMRWSVARAAYVCAYECETVYTIYVIVRYVGTCIHTLYEWYECYQKPNRVCGLWVKRPVSVGEQVVIPCMHRIHGHKRTHGNDVADRRETDERRLGTGISSTGPKCALVRSVLLVFRNGTWIDYVRCICVCVCVCAPMGWF